jgi:hypothetical protein
LTVFVAGLFALMIAPVYSDSPMPNAMPPAEEAIAEGEVTVPPPAAASAAVITGPQPRIVFEKTELDLGKLAEGQPGKFAFAFHNEGQAELKILNVSKSCGCTKADSTKPVLKPGEKAEIVGELDTHNRPGTQSKTVTVLSNDPLTPQVTLTFHAQVEQEIEIEPRYVNLGSVEMGDEVTQTVTIHNRSKNPMRIKGIESNNANIQVRVTSPVADTEAGKQGLESLPVVGDQPIVLEVRGQAGEQGGGFGAQITLTTDNPAKPRIDLSVYGRVNADILVYPQTVFFGLVQEGQTTTRTLTLESRTRTPFEIVGMRPSGIPLEIRQEPIPGPNKVGYVLRVGMTGKSTMTSGAGRIFLETTHPRQKTIEVQVVANVRPPQVRPAPQAGGGNVPPATGANK